MSRQYTRIVLSIVVAGLLAVAAFNALVDPYGVIGAPRIDGFNADKPEASRRERMSKAYEVRQIRPEAVLLGTSRALYLTPEHPHFQGLRAYNLALSDSSIYEHLRYFEHAMAVQPLSEAVVGLDFFAFREKTSAAYREGRLASSGSSHSGPVFDPADLLPALLSSDALRSSFSTIREQGRSHLKYTGDQNQAERVRSKGGHRAMFRELESGLLGTWGFDAEARRFEAIGSVETPGSFRKLLRLAHRREVKLHLFISPSHARLWEAWRLASTWPHIEEWKRAVVAANQEEARVAGRPPFPLWDFSGYNSITTEPVPPAGDRDSLMRGYWEGSHYSAATGRLVLDRLFGHEKPTRPLPDDFGVRLNEANIEAHLAAVRAAGERYRLASPQDVAELQEALERQRRMRSPSPAASVANAGANP